MLRVCDGLWFRVGIYMVYSQGPKMFPYDLFGPQVFTTDPLGEGSLKP